MFSLSTTAPRSAGVFRTSVLRAVQAVGTTHHSTSTMHENDPEVLEREKIRNLTKSQRKLSPHENAPGWNEKLASASEAAVKADKSTGKAEDLVNTTLDHLRTIREENEAESTTATYAREEVDGPLKGVGKEEVVIEREETIINGGRTNRVVKKTHKKFLGMTSSEENVKADRGGI